jgi:hypothetical protein
VNELIEIPFNRKGLLGFLIGSIIFSLLGFWFIIEPNRFIGSKVSDPQQIQLIGCISILFFGFGVGLFCYLLLSKRFALKILPEGFIHTTTYFNGGKIKWKDVDGFSTVEIRGNNLLLVHVKNPEDYINEAKNPFEKWTAKSNFKLYQTPIQINCSFLPYNQYELKELLENAKKTYLH